MQRDVVVLGAGIVGLATALKIQEKGRSVALVDRSVPGEGTSFGNAGIIERASIYPYAFPRRWRDLFKYALNTTPEAYYHLSTLPKIAPFMFRYWRASSPAGHEAAMRAALPLIERCVAEHEPLVEAAEAGHLLRRTGWLKLFRSDEKLAEAIAEAKELAPFGLTVDFLDDAGVRAMEPHLSEGVRGGIHFKDPVNVIDPGALSRAYLHLFEARGGGFLSGDARTLAQAGAGGWTVRTEAGTVTARDVVVALGPWSDVVYRPLGYRLPMAVKRGYHMHYRPAGNAVLNHTVFDSDNGYVLAPMARGIRLTTGAEFADRDAPPSPVQIARTEPHARRLFPLDGRVDSAPWMGSRPCTPDMVPVIGPAPAHKGLWFAFGHAHHGLTLSAVTGRLIAEMLTGETPFTDPRPYRADRF
ncbi:FAD-binding oxidoreductase [Alsobacter sp. SYSU M60028]|uniref:FAD-binding oxidoreductase n=1 Tax=Alsobacter ponti TaxID=2962936 RepID=A0ABT1LFZ4_9HYPH|nr:FAD-dependent oxidoreductase [Alsobacter ponti]MCP8940420.1 FAD-binding oxidoreductase [Alsobacter ponti]